jgi:hypothetical protein
MRGAPLILVALLGQRRQTLATVFGNGNYPFAVALSLLGNKTMTETRKTKRVAGGFDLPASAFALVLDENDSSTWKMPLFVPGNVALTQNFIKNALYRFSSTDTPDSARADVWRTIQGAAKAHGIKSGPQPACAPPGSTHPETAQLLDADSNELKEAIAVGALHAERFLKSIGYGGT